MVFLHGQIVVTIKRADDLRSAENYGLGCTGLKCVGKGLAKALRDHNDPYVNFMVGKQKLAATAQLANNKHPVWDETFKLTVCHEADNLTFDLKDRNMAGSSELGKITIPAMQLYEAPDKRIAGVFAVQHPFKTKTKGELEFDLRYYPLQGGDDFTSGPETPDVYFPAQPGNTVRMYQDAHNHPGLFPPVPMPDGTTAPVHPCWKDMYHTMNAAQQFIYLTGWSFHPDIRLIRDEDITETLGELLKRKADSGVKVHMMVWDDRSSVGWAGAIGLSAGMMGTYDEEVRTYFARVGVECALVGRTGGNSNTILEGQTAASCFTHHQKTVICDGDALPGQHARRVVAFVGGIDLTKGRYDTAKHDLFRTREGVHKDDYSNVSTGDKGGFEPREPWEDIHCMIDGPAAHQVCQNFTERWAQQGYGRSPLTPEQMGLAPPSAQASTHPNAFSVQTLRSIDARSAKFGEGEDRLLKKKGRTVDNSIMLGYVHQIRRSKHFIFIENQYFLGSSYNWSAQSDAGCNHTIPAELQYKICTKIERGERYAAYVITPLYPEGVPATDAVQGILQFQKLTMESMYKSIAVSISRRKLVDPAFEAHPTDYLNFYCLGKRETEEGWTPPTGPAPVAGVVGYESCVNRRFMIYVHSKLMITDDEHAIIGSANINMRSMAGARDSEIAAGIWQPAHAATAHDTPKGDVHGFRMSIWSEHMQVVEDCFRRPSELACVKRVNELARANWAKFIGNEIVEMSAHLMPWPIHVYSDGTLKAADDLKGGALSGSIPDFDSASMLGKKVPLPYVLTT